MNQPGKFSYRPRWASLLAVLFLSLSVLFMAAPAESKSRSTKAEKIKAAQETSTESEIRKGPAKPRVVSFTFKQMGAWSAIKLRGVDGAQTLSFPIRADEIVVAAKLRIAYDYSPALIPELSHLKISLNERFATVLPLPKDKGVGNTRDIDIDPRWFFDVNFLRFKLIGHYTRDCEDPFHSSLWLTLSDLGRLELTLAPLATVNDLKTLPAPFLDRRDNVALSLPFVFASNPSFGALRAAGILASWFGLQAGTRGAQFPVLLNNLPEGNAVVILPGGKTFEGIRGTATSTVSIQPHPSNPQAKLLVISGGNDEDLARAARAVALFASTLSGPSVTVSKEAITAARKPYDAPAWVPVDRPVRFGEIARPEELRTQGYFPEVIRLNYRVSPDLFAWRTPGAPLALKYRATRLPGHRSSSLNIGINANFIRALAINEPYKVTTEAEYVKDKTSVREELLFIPPYGVSGRDQLQFSYFFDFVKEGHCRNMPPDNLQGAIDPESTIDFSDFPHYVALPNLAYFSTMGFPFTRMADLSETAVVLPDTPNADELSLYLTLMGRMGEATAYPALRHALIAASDIEKMATRDLLLIGSAKSQSLMAKWADRLPMVQNGGDRYVREPDAVWRPTYRWEQEDVQEAHMPKGGLTLTLTGVGNLAALMAFESPLAATRSVVFLYADKAADLRKLSDVLSDPERTSSLQGDFAVVDDKGVSHAKVSPTYYLGSLPWLSKLRWFFSDQPILLGLLAGLICLLMAAIIYRKLGPIRAKRIKKTT
ncbi:MAG: cellulose biosynthesis cyclic di-GMP-binding regulatory protein BcsB [Comamonadaceae bacterium]